MISARETASIAARLERLPAGRAMWMRVFLLSLGGFFEFYDMFMSAYVGPGLVKSGILTPTTPGLFGTTGLAGFVAAFFAGLFIGTALFGFVADRFGRRVIFTTSLLWYTLAASVMAFQTSAFGLDLWRSIAGIGIGVELVTIDSYIAELVPRHVRGRAFAFNQVVQFSAIPAVAFLAWLLVPYAPFGLDGWRWVVLAGSAGAVVVWFIRLAVPESPRWLAEHGRLGEAERILERFEREAVAESGALAEPEVVQPSPSGRGRFMEIWSPAYRRRTLMLIVFNLFQTVGFYGFANWVPSFLIKQGIAVTASLGYTFVIAIAAPFGPLLAVLVSDRVERKWMIAGSALLVAAFGLVFAEMREAVPLILFGALITLANNVMSFSFHAYQAELYPTRIRALGVGFVYSFSRLSTVFSAFVIAFFLDRFGVVGVFSLIALSMGVVAFAIGVFGPRTRNLSLEAISG
ncbi:MAG TPA: MFS transporter [Rhizomicrobium sp.]|jgi:MFS transporter, putative metabolite:H+ symporter